MSKRNYRSSTPKPAPQQATFTADQLAPHSVEAEEAVLGAALISPDALLEVGFLAPEDFFIVRHQWIFEALRALDKERTPIDYLTVITKLEESNRLTEVGGAAAIIALVNKTPSALNCEGYGRIVERMAIRRRLIDAASQLARLAHSEEPDIDKVLEQAERSVQVVGEKRAATTSTIQSAADLALAELALVDEWHANPVDIRGMRCGIDGLDQGMGGFEPGMYYKVAGPPGIGKSALLAQMAGGFAAHDDPCLFFSLEMPAIELIRRIICQRARVNNMTLRQGKLTRDELDRYKAAAQQVSKLPLWIEQQAGLSVRQMQSIARRYQRERGIKAVFIDTINRVGDIGKGSTPYQGMTNTSIAVADWAHNSPYLIMDASQLSRAHHNSADKRPRLHDLRDSGSQEQDADGIFMLYREAYYYPEKTEKQNVAEVILRKNRYGTSNYTIELFWNPTWPGFAKLEKTTIDLNPPAAPKPDSLIAARRKLERQTPKVGELEDIGDGMLLPTGTAGK